jgi:hypothetical protein
VHAISSPGQAEQNASALGTPNMLAQGGSTLAERNATAAVVGAGDFTQLEAGLAAKIGCCE